MEIIFGDIHDTVQNYLNKNVVYLCYLKFFFNKGAVVVAKSLLGKVIRAKYENIWLSAKIIETKVCYIHEKFVAN